MQTRAGVQLTKEEEAVIKSFQRLARKWNKQSKRLWLFSGAGSLYVMMGQYGNNPHPERNDVGSVNQQNCIVEIPICNEGGDW